MGMDLTTHWVGYAAIIIFTFAYILVIAEEFTHLRKSKPVLLSAGLIWALVAFQYASSTTPHVVEEAVRHFLVEFSELFLYSLFILLISADLTFLIIIFAIS